MLCQSLLENPESLRPDTVQRSQLRRRDTCELAKGVVAGSDERPSGWCSDASWQIEIVLGHVQTLSGGAAAITGSIGHSSTGTNTFECIGPATCCQPPGGSGSWPNGGRGVKIHADVEASVGPGRPSVHPS